MPKPVPEAWQAKLAELTDEARSMIKPGEFFFDTQAASGESLSASGTIDRNGWHADSFTIRDPGGEWHTYEQLDQVPEEFRGQLAALVDQEGVERKSLLGYVRENGELPKLDWLTLVAFAAIAGSGGLANTLFSNYCRDKGWGMGARVGAIPSAVGGLPISLSHVGEVFPIDQTNLHRWKGWMRHMFRDQTTVWMTASFIGMALPCMLSLQFIRNATVAGDRVAAMTAEGIAVRYPEYAGLFWTMTLLCGFLVLAPGQISVGDQIARRWTDIVWTASKPHPAAGRHSREVRLLQYPIGCTRVWGLFVLWRLPALDIAKIGAVLGNIALGFSSLHALYANRALLPKELQPAPGCSQIGTLLCGVFFIGISLIVMADVIATINLF